MFLRGVKTAKTGVRVMELFQRVAQEVVDRGIAKTETPQQIVLTPATTTTQAYSCCGY
jgi:hypothetical protein